MFAVIRSGGKQYSVSADDRIKVEKLPGEPGDMVELAEVLMVGNTVGAPLVDGAMVTAEIVEQGRARKVIAFKKRRRQNSRRTIGHRQHFTMLQILEVLTDGKKPTKKPGAAAKAKKQADEKAAAADSKADKKADAKPAKKDADKPAAKEAAGKDDAKKQVEKSDKAAKDAPSKDEAPKKPAKARDGAASDDGKKDKLTEIKGIGPVAERQLNEHGITTFAGIAALTDEEIAKIDDALPFSAEQLKDWQSQAKDKAKG